MAKTFTITEPINITVVWDRFGWVATALAGEKSRHCTGPREAAEDFLKTFLEPGKYSLKFKAHGWYQAHEKSSIVNRKS